MEPEGWRRKGHHKAAKRQSRGGDAFLTWRAMATGTRQEEGSGEQTLERRRSAPFWRRPLEACTDVEVNRSGSIFASLLSFVHAENSDLTRLSQHQSLAAND